MKSDPTNRRLPDGGLCEHCRHSKIIESAGGSQFLRCERSFSDPTFPKYPRLPVLSCRGYEASVDDNKINT
jgi:hypothetical protein